MRWGPVFAKMFDGSLFGAGAHVHATLTYLVSRGYPDGVITASPAKIAAAIGEPVEKINEALDRLCSEDKKSDNQDEGGRAIIRESPVRFRLVNWSHFQKLMVYEKKRLHDRETKRQERSLKSEKTPVSIDSSSPVESCRVLSHIREEKRREEKKGFQKPSPEEIQAYLDEKKETSFSGQYFFDANEGKGWVVGTTKTPMKDWKAVVRTWISNRKSNETQSQQDTKGMWGIPGRDVERFVNYHGRTPISVEEFTEWNKDVPF